MNNTGCALIGLAAWAIIQTFVLVFVRLNAVRAGHPINTFDPTGKDLRGFAYRVTRAHGNTLENLAIFAGLLLYAIATSQTAITEGLACWLLYARIGQSVVHMFSTSAPFVLLRANLFGAQMIIGLWWAWQFWHA
ncbi:MAG: hypothetical protein RL434_2152 [Pseudomonadota bacterium]